ncbi:hypothetical protein PVAND_016404 [Polypedilum vanderplanki]|uniref:Leucine rich repeat protein n=1 Tax=Polypedilum vanderplanki TaxID=319348 RepID=A0A9J6BFR1_POLVA|nr:hypothetical protein PVAND_016404 [Polypedilum vanderplanki]
MGEINCDIIYSSDVQNPEYVLFVRYVNTTHQKITSINMSTFEKENVIGVMFYKTTLPTFPSELGEFFPNLRKVDIFGSELEKITKDDLKNFPKLERLRAESNKLKYLPNDLFEFTPLLSHVDFSHNQIDKIGANIFDNCKNLIEADFKHNKTINISYKKENMKFEELKEVFKKDCKPVKSLKNLAEEAVIGMMKKENAKEIFFIAQHCGFDKLKEKSVKILVKQEKSKKFAHVKY